MSPWPSTQSSAASRAILYSPPGTAVEGVSGGGYFLVSACPRADRTASITVGYRSTSPGLRSSFTFGR